jgi:pimeloyl-ACP methyl ester carboxylesterase
LAAKGIPVGVYGEVDQVAVLLHGRNGRKENLLSVAERMCAAGMVCVIPDLPSHGESPVATVGFGARDFERSLPGKVADEAVAALGLGALPPVLWGMSMGGSFAIHAVDLEPKRWKRMVIVSSFDAFGGVMHDSWAGWFRPLLDPMVEARGGADVEGVRPVDLVGRLRVPTLFVHGDADELIGLERGRRLYEGYGGKKKFLVVEGGTHSNVLVTEAPVYVEMAAWLRGW